MQQVNKIIEAYKERRGSVALHLMEEHGNDHTLTGVSEGSLKSFLGGKWTPLIELLASGEIKGLAGVVGCSNLTAGGHDVLSVELTKELISRDILVLTAGCSSGGIENCGLMTPEAAKYAGPKLRAVCEKLNIPPVLNFGPCLAIGRLEIVATEIAAELGVDLPQLPLVLSAAQWLEEQALADGSIDAIATEALYKEADLVIIGLYPQATVDWLLENMPKMKKGCVIVDMVGVKQFMVDHLEQAALDAGVHYVGGHPMAGREFSGLDYSLPTLFDGASMIFVPTKSSTERVLEQLEAYFMSLGFGQTVRCTAQQHDHMIAFTSQLAHVVSSAYIKSPEADKHNGYSAGSYKDLTRVAKLNETMWSELFLCNAEPLAQEIDEVIKHLDEYRKAIRAGDREELTILLRDGRERKERLG